MKTLAKSLIYIFAFLHVIYFMDAKEWYNS